MHESTSGNLPVTGCSIVDLSSRSAIFVWVLFITPRRQSASATSQALVCIDDAAHRKDCSLAYDQDCS